MHIALYATGYVHEPETMQCHDGLGTTRMCTIMPKLHSIGTKRIYTFYWM